MAKQYVESHLNFQKVAELQGALIGVETPTVEREIGANDTEHRIEVMLNGVVEKIANLSDIEALAGQSISAGELQAGNPFLADFKNSNGDTVFTLNLQPAVEADLAAIASGTLDSDTGIVTWTREDGTTFDLDLSALIDIPLIQQVADDLQELSDRVENDVIPVVNAKADQEDVQTAIDALNANTEFTHIETVTVPAGGTVAVSFPNTPTFIGKAVVTKNGQEVTGAEVYNDARTSLSITSLVGGDFIVSVEYRVDPVSSGTDVILGDASEVAVDTGGTPLNVFTWSTGNTPSLSAFETAIGITLENGSVNGDSIEFDNTGYTIGANAFQGDSNLISVQSVATAVDNFAFTSCSNLQSVTMNELVSAGNAVFAACTSIASIDLPSITDAGNATFEACSSLVSVNLPVLDTIGSSTFLQCNGLLSVDLPLLTSIGDNTFFESTSLTSVSLPLITSIGDNTFDGCTALTSINIPLVTSIGSTVDNSSIDQVFRNITGNTISITANSSLQTANSGGLEADLAELDSNNTVTFTWI